ncbi:MAG: hypothetical protein ABI537_06145 [Casimicrobiaceae bacterium]
MDTISAFLGNNTTLVDIGIVLVIAAGVMGIWQGIKSLRGSNSTNVSGAVTTADMRRDSNVRLEA